MYHTDPGPVLTPVPIAKTLDQGCNLGKSGSQVAYDSTHGGRAYLLPRDGKKARVDFETDDGFDSRVAPIVDAHRLVVRFDVSSDLTVVENGRAELGKDLARAGGVGRGRSRARGGSGALRRRDGWRRQLTSSKGRADTRSAMSARSLGSVVRSSAGVVRQARGEVKTHNSISQGVDCSPGQARYTVQSSGRVAPSEREECT